jgi:para-nitrobenzyl esterase
MIRAPAQRGAKGRRRRAEGRIAMGPIVETTHGKLEGVQEVGHQRFRGIPFARPPVGARRFRAPEPAEPWAGVRDASAFAASAPQNPSPLPGMAVGEQSEDCLYLNVYTPAADGGRRPVLFWIHGGGFTGGSGSQALYDGGRLATRGDVVVVTINYRLGALGYLALAGVTPNLGQLDQIAALRWVRDNIARFGGDPDNVTIFGESAGGMAVATLLAMPAARGLFRRAIPQSGAAHHTQTHEAAGRVARTLLEELGGIDAAKLADVPVAALLAAQARTQAKLMTGLGSLGFAPVIDGDSIPVHPLHAVRDGAGRDVELLVGTTRDETKLFRMGAVDAAPLDEARLLRRVRGMLGRHESDAERVIESYRTARAGRASTDPSELLDAIESDRSFRLPAIRLAEAQHAHQPDTFMYLFSWESPARRGALGACHALELPFVFGTLDAPTMDRFAGSGPDAEALSARMMDAWLAFARGEGPGHSDLPDWSPYETKQRATLVFDRTPALEHAPLDAERAVWDGIL